MRSPSSPYHRPVALILVLLALAAASVQVAAADTLTRSFDVRPGGRLVIDTDLGAIEVRSGSGDRVAIEVTREVRRGRAEDALEDFAVEFDQRGDEVRVEGRYRKGARRLFDWGSRLRVRFAVTVPRRFDLDLDTAGGSISVEDLEGEVRAQTSGGSLSFGDIRGPVWGRTSGGSIALAGSLGKADVETSGGSIRIGEVDGPVRAHTSGGSIRIDRARGSVDAHTSGGGIEVEEVLGAIQAHTSGGSITARISEQPRQACSLETSGGSITVYLAPGVGVDVDARASGRVTADMPVEARSQSRTALSGTVHGGGPRLLLRTSGGSIYLREGGR